MFFSAMVVLLEFYAFLRNVEPVERTAPLCARCPPFVPGSLSVLISDFTHQHGVVNVVNAEKGRAI